MLKDTETEFEFYSIEYSTSNKNYPSPEDARQDLLLKLNNSRLSPNKIKHFSSWERVTIDYGIPLYKTKVTIKC